MKWNVVDPIKEYMLFIYSTSGIEALEKDVKYVQINKGDFRTTLECHSSDFIVDLFIWTYFTTFSCVSIVVFEHSLCFLLGSS